MSDENQFLTDLNDVLFQHRWAALATQSNNGPSASMVAYAVSCEEQGLLFFLSQLAPHTRQLMSQPQCSIVISEADVGGDDPQTLKRLSLNGCVEVVAREEGDRFAALQDIFCQRLPASERLFSFGDFSLFVFKPSEGRFVGGFARAQKVSAQTLANLFQSNL